MAITFNSSATNGDVSVTGIYAHIDSVSGPHKKDAVDAIAEQRNSDGDVIQLAVAAQPVSWFITYGVVIHKDRATRVSDTDHWNKRIPSRAINRFKLKADNLDNYPTLAVLYGDLKTQIASICSSIEDA